MKKQNIVRTKRGKFASRTMLVERRAKSNLALMIAVCLSAIFVPAFYYHLSLMMQ